MQQNNDEILTYTDYSDTIAGTGKSTHVHPQVGREYFQCSRKDICPIVADVEKAKNSIESENKKLQEVFQIGIKEFEKKNHYISELELKLKETEIFYSEAEKENKSLRMKLEEKTARIKLLNKMIFGKKSDVGIKELNDGVKTEEEICLGEHEETSSGHYVAKTTKRGAKKSHKGYGRKIPDNLPVEEKIIDLAEDKKHCEICGIPFIDTGMEEVSNEISSKKYYYVKRTRRKKYKRGCNCGLKLITAPSPDKLIRKGKFSIEFWVEVLVNKFMKHLPVARQTSEMKMYGINVSAGTIIGGFKTIYSSFIEPLYQCMKEELQKSNRWHADETGWRVFIKIEGKKNYKWFIWVFISEDIVLFAIDPTRSSKVPYKVLFDMDYDDVKKLSDSKLIDKVDAEISKILNADKYLGYKALQNQGLILIAYCWAHQRREFTDLVTKYPEDAQLKEWVGMWVCHIGKLYKINNERIKHKQGTSAFDEYQQNLQAEIDWIKKETEKEYKHQGQIEVINSIKEHWSGLTLFVTHPEIPMDNNLSERVLRPAVLGRKNYWGNHSIWGGKLSAAMYSIIQTCFLHSISPVAYLNCYFQKCANYGAAPDKNEIFSFLPHKLPENIKQVLKIPETEMLDDR